VAAFGDDGVRLFAAHTIVPGFPHHTFKPNHRIRLEIASSNFPRFDRNLNSRVTPALGRAADAQKAVQQVFHSAPHPSHLSLPVAAEPAAPSES
jgi:hypothetical protein